MSWLSEFRVDAKAPRRRREGSQGAVPPSKKEAASAADAPGTGIEKGCKMQSREYAPQARGVAGGCAPFKEGGGFSRRRSGYGNRKRLQKCSLFPRTRSRGRTGTASRPLVFETSASTDSAIRANRRGCKCMDYCANLQICLGPGVDQEILVVAPGFAIEPPHFRQPSL